VGLIAVAGAFHDHEAAKFEGPAIGVPSAAAGFLLHHDCLACKIAAPLATPSFSAILIDPGLLRHGPPASIDDRLPDAAPERLTPPRGPPPLSLA
jgi:hypothetical protein